MMSRKQQMDAELSYLKAQINPHFLFNTLNTIYSLSISKSDETPDSVLRLSGLMRYVLYDAHQDNVPLDKEINYLKDYIDLQKMRLGDTVLLSYSLPDAGDYFRIAPLLLIPFIENAFKFGVNPEKESKIEIFIDVKGNELIMKVNNNKVTQPLPEENRDKIGVDNTISRLAMLYPGRHSLEINESEVDYRMKLKILLT
jgi:LytS/YehU family sensor histidine kinase